MVVTDGPVDPRSRLFVGRAEELKTLETWLANIDCVGAVKGARQTGKTSLLFKLRHRLQRKYAFAFINLQYCRGSRYRRVFHVYRGITQGLNPWLIAQVICSCRETQESS